MQTYILAAVLATLAVAAPRPSGGLSDDTKSSSSSQKCWSPDPEGTNKACTSEYTYQCPGFSSAAPICCKEFLDCPGLPGVPASSTFQASDTTPTTSPPTQVPSTINAATSAPAIPGRSCEFFGDFGQGICVSANGTNVGNPCYVEGLYCCADITDCPTNQGYDGSRAASATDVSLEPTLSVYTQIAQPVGTANANVEEDVVYIVVEDDE